MPRTDTASRLIAARSERVSAALLDPDALLVWLPPTGLTGRLERFDRRVSPTGGAVSLADRLPVPHRDSVGAVDGDGEGAELLFQIITAREEKASIACASNAPFSEWGATFPDPRLAAAVVDRLTFKAHIIQTGATSYRLRATREARKGAATT